MDLTDYFFKPEVMFPVVTCLIGFGIFQEAVYDFSRDVLLNSRRNFNSALKSDSNLENSSLYENLSDSNKEIYNMLRKSTIRDYNYVSKVKLPNFLIFSNPCFYYNSIKELRKMKSFSKKRIEELVQPEVY